jgi:hypothetical protein
MKENRIYFKDNPWPEGHPIKNFTWSAEIREGDVWFHFHIETDDYYSERDIENDEDVEYESDWHAPIVWGNYHRCTMSTNDWHNGGFRACSKEEYTEEFLDGLEIKVDMDPDSIDDWDDYAFHIYLLGHDAVAKHKIKFIRTNQSKFDIEWSGKIAQAYVGDYNFKHDFKTLIKGVEAPNLNDIA